jgi:peptidyl-tRNA hydrolase, PTH1 family
MNNNPILNLSSIKAIIGLGNPGRAYYYNRHNIGFRVVEEVTKLYHGSFKSNDLMELAQINANGKPYFLILPQTFMNLSGKVIPFLSKKGITAENILVVHDELELPFGKMKFKHGGSAKGHNGLKSIIQYCGADFYRLAIGIGRPANREDVPKFVLEDFEDSVAAQEVIQQAVTNIETSVINS